jgi:hypothetical protein
MKIKTSELIGPALDYAVAKALGLKVSYHGKTHWLYDDVRGHDDFLIPSYSTDWAQGGPVIEREGISFRKYHNPGRPGHGKYYAQFCLQSGSMVSWSKERASTGPTALISSMRCYVASELGGEIEIPDELGIIV